MLLNIFKKATSLLGIILSISCYLLPDVSFAQYTKLLDFADTTNGINPRGTLVSDGLFLYGMTNKGGTNGGGNIFKIKPDGTSYSAIFQFDSINGTSPFGSLILDSVNLYGMTPQGGNTNMGVLFKIKRDGTGYTKMIDFAGSANGSYPVGSLIENGAFLYGMAQYGGANDMGTLFKIKTDGTGYSRLFDFDSLSGRFPFGSLISDGTYLYGMTNQGGINNLGVIFKIKTDGTAFSKLLDFAGAANGQFPRGSLFFDGIFLYGMTDQGGANDMGVVFKIKPDGSAYTDILDFAGTSNGRSPWGSLISDGVFLYGMTRAGGADNTCGSDGCGALFKVMTDGTGYTKLVDFGASNGSAPYGALVAEGSFVYGLTANGGSGSCITGCGTIFRYDWPVGITESVKSTDFNVFPNPFSSQTTILFNNDIKKGEVKIVDVLGKELRTLRFTGERLIIERGELLSGIYFIQLKTEQGVVSKKLILTY